MWQMIPTIHKKIHFYKKGREVDGKRSASTKHRNNACKSGFSCNFDNFQFFSRVLSKFETEIRFDIFYFRYHHLIKSETHSLSDFSAILRINFFRQKQKKCWFFLPRISLLLSFVFRFFKENEKSTLFYVASLF